MAAPILLGALVLVTILEAYGDPELMMHDSKRGYEPGRFKFAI